MKRLRAPRVCRHDPPLDTALDELRSYLQAQPVTFEVVPGEIARDGSRRMGATRSRSCRRAIRTTTRRCANSRARAGCRAERDRRPDRDPGIRRTVIRAFFEAGFWALASITILLWVVLRRFVESCSPSFRCSCGHRDHGADGPSSA